MKKHNALSPQDLREQYICHLDKDSKKAEVFADALFHLDLTVYSENNTFASIVYNAFAQSHIDESISLHPKQMAILKTIEDNDASIISAPTSCGKTFCIFEYIAKHTPHNVVLIVPTLALADEYRRKFNSINKGIFDEYRIHISIIEDKEYDFSQKNIFILTHDKAIHESSYIKLEKIDFLVIDEVYKLQKKDDDDRVLVLNMAYYYLAQKANKYVLLAPFIAGIKKIEVLEKRPTFYRTDYSPVVNEVIFCEIEYDDEDIRFRKCKEILDNKIEQSDKTLVYFPTVKSLCHYVHNIVAQEPVQDPSSSEAIKAVLEWAKKEIHEDWYLVKALERGYLIHNAQIPLGLRILLLDCYNDGEV